MYDLLAFCALSLLALGLAAAVGGRGAAAIPAKLVVAAVAVRILGSTLRYEVLYRFYNGLGDAVLYYYEGLDLRRWIWSFQLSPLSLEYWMPHSRWWGTLFLERISGVVLAGIGPSLRGEFLVFALLSFAGLWLMVQALPRVQPGAVAVHQRFAAWMWLWPSLWFWPSSVGKEAIAILAIGLATYGYVGSGKAIRWVPFIAGIGLAFCIRPHVAAVLALAAGTAHWLGSFQRMTGRRIVEALVALVIAGVSFQGMLAQFGLADADLEGVVEFVEFRTEQTLQGGSNVGAPPFGPHGIPIALANVWMRPFPWDVHNLTSAVAAAEVLLFWALAWRRRHELRIAIRNWRHHRMLLFGLPFLLLYSLMIGLAFGNLGIIARQRTPLLPFALLFLVAVPDRVAAARRASERQAVRARRAA